MAAADCLRARRVIGASAMPRLRLDHLAAPLFVPLWATGFIVARLVAPYAEPFTFLVLRYAIVTGVLVAASLAMGAKWPATWQGWRDGLIAGILLHGFYLGGVFWAVANGLPAGVSALIAGLQPLLVASLAGPILGERVSPTRWAGIVMGFAGALLVLLPRLGVGAGFTPLVIGVSLLSTLSQSAGTLWQKRTAGGLDLRTNATLQYVGALIGTVPFALLLETGRLDPAPAFWTGLFWSVFGMSIGAVGLLLFLLRRGAVAGVSALMYLVPPVAALMSYGLFGESLTPLQLAGMALAAAGVAVAHRG